MKKGKVVLGIAAGLFVLYVGAAPYITLYQMKSAADRHDGEALSEHIEFASVRQSIKDQMNAVFAKNVTKDAELKNNPIAVFGAALAGMMVDKMVDAYVTPAGITQLMAGEKPLPKAGKSEEGPGNPVHKRKPFSEASMSYESLNKFVVTVKANNGGEGKFVLVVGEH